MHFAPQIRREISTNYDPTFQAGRKAVALGQAGRKMRVVCAIPTAGGGAIVIGIAVVVALMLVAASVIVFMFAAFVMAVAMIVVAVVTFVASVVVLGN